MRIKHLALTIKNLEQSIKFYEIMAGLSVSRRVNAGTAKLAFMINKEDQTEIELIHFPDRPTFEGKGMFICFETDKLEVMHQVAVENGYHPSDIQDPGDQTRYFYVYDPDGVSVQLRSFPKA